MKKCLFCGKDLENDYLSNKVGYFCNEEQRDWIFLCK